MIHTLLADGVLFSGTSWHYLVGPLVAGVAIGFLALVLRWSTFRSPGSTPRKPKRKGRAEPTTGGGFGLLVPVATSAERDDLDRLRTAMAAHGLRSTVGVDGAGVPALLVFPTDYSTARRLLEQAG